MARYLRIASRVFGRPLLVLPETAETIAGFLLARDAGQLTASETVMRRAPAASRFGGESIGVGDPMAGTYEEYYRRVGAAAVATVEGELVNRGAWVGASSGLTSYEGVAAQLEMAARDDKVREIVVDMETPGGEAVGAMEMAATVRRINAIKPVTVVVNGMAASAGYAMASAASRIVTVPSGIVGSIGVVLLHVDQSAMLEKRGVTPTLIFAGAHKVDGNPFEPLPDAVRADLQAEVETFYRLFVATVAAGRPGLSEAAVMATEARTFIGADAVSAGLADAVGTIDDVLAEINRTAPRGRAGVTKGTSMSDEKIHSAVEMTAAVEAARREAAAAERARIAAILDHEAADGRGGLARELALHSDTSPEAAARILGAAAKEAPGTAALTGRASSGAIGLALDPAGPTGKANGATWDRFYAKR
ncbi:signal peptide peptidase SppA [Pseudoxanthobacter soli DSM 19599]|uniref:Signal peptide peptidase SppA n=1 Tax=Pseudoxanthobacter soli DSM 19599 TaxID=1123029 RepID=A0A1M7ZLP3_9HYPH|nr:S49 family peptidase [Pseudoxanthobacter soli]SHO65823.1 signal peptide peptidase SppA [Pseudoxanthobacter soli DSM 19599]